MSITSLIPSSRRLADKIWHLNWGLIVVLCLIAGIGVAMLYSAAGGDLEPWAWRQAVRFGIGCVLMIAVAVTDIRLWLRVAYGLYGVGLVLLIAVEFLGDIGMGAQRWIDFGIIQFQPSELMKVALVMAMARYFHSTSPEEAGWGYLLPPALMVLAPAALVMRQPDLGTAMLLVLSASLVMFLAGIRVRYFVALAVAAVAALPVGWQFLHDYQRRRVLTFLDPERDPLGAGYHILQSKIALGSGGLFGKGYLQGSQSYLNYLPEKQTDFMFTMLAEEWGLLGGLVLLTLYGIVLLYGFVIALSARNHFGRLLALGLTGIFFIYIFINVAMVTGILPVVGVPLPLVSYGGTSLLSLQFGFGLLMCVWVHRDERISRHGQPSDG